MHLLTNRNLAITAWVLLVGLLVALAWTQLAAGLVLRADVLTLLPSSQQDLRTQQAIDHLSADFERQLLIALVPRSDSPNFAELSQAANQLQTSSDASKLFEPQKMHSTPDASTWRNARFQLLDEKTRELIANNPERLLQDAQAQLFGLAVGSVTYDVLQDPLQLERRYLDTFAPSGIEPLSGSAFLSTRDATQAIITPLRLRSSAFDAKRAEALLGWLEQARVKAAESNFTLAAGGVPLFAAAAAVQARKEVATFGLLSIVGVIALLVGVFASIRPIVGTVLCIGTGAFAGFVCTHAAFGEVHLLTLVFGVSLVGISVDYALHFLCDGINDENWSPAQGIRSVAPGITLAVLSSIAAFMSFLGTPFPGLQQVAVFSAVGLAFAWLTVFAILPWLARNRVSSFGLMLRAGLARWAQNWPFVSPRLRIAPGLVLLGLIAIGLTTLRPNDDIRLLQSAEPSIVNEDATARRFVPYSRASQFFIVNAASEAELISAETEFVAALKSSSARTGSIWALSSMYPTITDQTNHYELIQRSIYESGLLAAWYQSIGVPPEQVAQNKQAFDAAQEAISLDRWGQSAPEPWQRQWLGCDDEGCRTTVTLESVTDATELEALADRFSNVAWIDPVGNITDVLARYRALATQALALVYVGIACLLMLLFGPGRGLRIVAVPGFAVCTALAACGFLGVPFSLFTLLAAMVVIGISLDFSLFYHLHGRRRPNTALAIALSATTTVLAFGMLSFSSTAVIETFGKTLFIGIISAFAVAPFASYKYAASNENSEPKKDTAS